MSDSLFSALWTGLFKLEWVRNYWAKHYHSLEYDQSPWTPLRKPVAESRLTLLSTGGVHLAEDVPFDMSDHNGDPGFRQIPLYSSPGEWTVTHDYYDHSDARQDWNLVFPLERLQELQSLGEIGELTPTHYSLMGHIDGPHLPTLLHQTARELAKRLREEHADLALLVPA